MRVARGLDPGNAPETPSGEWRRDASHPCCCASASTRADADDGRAAWPSACASDSQLLAAACGRLPHALPPAHPPAPADAPPADALSDTPHHASGHTASSLSFRRPTARNQASICLSFVTTKYLVTWSIYSSRVFILLNITL